jgi:hypothetical protein
VYSYDALGSLSASPLGDLVAGPAANAVGTRAVQLGAGGVIIGATALTFMSSQVRHLRADAPVVPPDARPLDGEPAPGFVGV